MDDNSKSSHQIASVESVQESTKRQKIKYVKQIIAENFNEYRNNPNLQTPNDIDNFAKYLVSKSTFFLATTPVELKHIIDLYLPGYMPSGGRRKSRKNRRKSKKSRKHRRKSKRHSRR